MLLRVLPLLLFLLPAIAAHASLAISQSLGLVPVCNVYLDGCTSISATGRNEPAIFVFRGLLMPTAVLLPLFWYLAGHWLAVLGAASRTRVRTLQLTGLVGAVFLMLYVLFLGTDGEVYRLLRRYGVHLFFAFTYLSQLQLSYLLYRHRRAGVDLVPRWLGNLMLGLCALMLGVGLTALPAAEWALARSTLNNVMAWNMGALGMSWFVLAWLAWRITGFEGAFRAAAAGSAAVQWPRAQ